jgi:SAM-dependent MidA family methyltransferase
MVERNPHAQERQRTRLQGWDNVDWKDSVVDLQPVEAGIVFANEVLDNLPVHLLERRDHVLWEVCITAEAECLQMTLLPPSSPELERFLQRTEIDLPEGHRMEVSLAAESLVARLASVVGRGGLLLVDYGAEASALSLRAEGSLVSYSIEGADDDVLAHPGSKDITSHVNWTSVRRAGEVAGLVMIGPRPQRQVLRSLGLSEMDRGLASRHQREIHDGLGAEAVGTLSRRHALRVLADEGGLGGLGVLAGLANIPPPPFLA